MLLGTFLMFAFLELVASKDSPCNLVKIVSRSEWLARNAVREKSLSLPVNHIIILHTVTPFCRTEMQCIRSVQFMQELHLDERGWWDIAYNFLIGGDGRVYEGRGWNIRGSHSKNYNAIAIGIAFMGNFNKYEASKPMIDAALNLIECGVEKGYLTPTREIHGHRDVSCTESPGEKLYATIRHWKNYKGGRLENFNCTPLKPPVINKDQIDEQGLNYTVSP